MLGNIVATVTTPSVTAGMDTALNGIKSDVLGSIAVAAPVALGIMGAFLAWKYGAKFFKSLSK